MGLLDGEKKFDDLLAISTEYWCATDGQTYTDIYGIVCAVKCITDQLCLIDPGYSDVVVDTEM